jgi:hypothetical protein
MITSAVLLHLKSGDLAEPKIWIYQVVGEFQQVQ